MDKPGAYLAKALIDATADELDLLRKDFTVYVRKDIAASVVKRKQYMKERTAKVKQLLAQLPARK
jgi:hypothetical protein